MLFVRRQLIMALLFTFGILAVAQPQSGWTAFNRPGLYEFGAGHCISCKEMAKIIEELKSTIGDKVEFRMLYAEWKSRYFSNIRLC